MIAPGTTIGTYEILAKVGEGGMGEVYRARDRKLDRDVALKLLPDAFASDLERLARFDREAKALAALNHPNIAQIYAFGGDLFASRFDLETRSVVGGRVAVLEGVRRTLNATTGTAHVDASSTGTLVYIPGPSGRVSADRAIAKANRSGTVTALSARAGPYVHVRATRDGARLALDTDDGKDANIWIYETDGKSDVNRLTFGGKNRFPLWSPDATRVAFQSDREGDLGIWVQGIDGTGVERLTKAAAGEAHVPESWSPDAASIAFAVTVTKEGMRPTFELRMLSLKNRTSVPFGDVRSVGEPIGAVFSADGRWIAYHSRARAEDSVETGSVAIASREAGIFVQPFPATGLKYQAPKLSIDFQPVWSPAADELFYVPLAASGQLAAVQVIKTGSGVRFSTPQTLPARVTGNRTSGSTRAFDVLPDGQFVGPISSSEEAALAAAASSSEIRFVVNWFEELKQKVPIAR
jgi:protein kinase-like protein/WD40 repeat protein